MHAVAISDRCFLCGWPRTQTEPCDTGSTAKTSDGHCLAPWLVEALNACGVQASLPCRGSREPCLVGLLLVCADSVTDGVLADFDREAQLQRQYLQWPLDGYVVKVRMQHEFYRISVRPLAPSHTNAKSLANITPLARSLPGRGFASGQRLRDSCRRYWGKIRSDRSSGPMCFIFEVVSVAKLCDTIPCRYQRLPNALCSIACVRISESAGFHYPYWLDEHDALDASVSYAGGNSTVGAVLNSWVQDGMLGKAVETIVSIQMLHELCELILKGEWQSVVCLSRWERSLARDRLPRPCGDWPDEEWAARSTLLFLGPHRGDNERCMRRGSTGAARCGSQHP